MDGEFPLFGIQKGPNRTEKYLLENVEEKNHHTPFILLREAITKIN